MRILSYLKNLNKMPIFTQRLNPVSGKNDWILQNEDYDYKQEVARSSYADMLHDTERNEKYFEGLKKSIELLRNQNKEVHLLDIGTGTGLLSLMALSCGVDSVTACEAFTPMAKCAAEIFELNGYMDKVTLIEKRSTEIELGLGKDMERKANLLVTEVFDTELIGEGAIETFLHAKNNLLTEDALIVPSESTVYAQVISSDLVRRWNKIEHIFHPEDSSKSLLHIPNIVKNCSGAAAVHDLQMSEIPCDQYIPLSKPIPIFQFDWSGRKIPLLKNNTSIEEFECLSNGSADAIFFWWDLKMDPQGQIILSCAPIWHHPLTKNTENPHSFQIPWRDHWMQAVYYLPQEMKVEKSEKLSLISSHDEYSLWFNIAKEGLQNGSSERPVCDCSLHATASRTRIGQMNDPLRRAIYLPLLKKHVNKDTVALFIGDCCLLAIVAANLGAHHVYVSHSDGLSNRVVKEFISVNKVEDRVTLLEKCLSDISPSDLCGPIDFVFSEPHFDTSLLPWHSLQLTYKLKEACSTIFKDNVRVFPQRLDIRAIPVQFRDLWKIRAPLHTCSGFQMTPFDDLIESASKESDDPVEPQPLWEYPSTALGFPNTLLSISICGKSKNGIQNGETETRNTKSENETQNHETETQNKETETQKRENETQNRKIETYNAKTETKNEINLQIGHPGSLNGLALWADWIFDDQVLCTGPVSPVRLGKEIDWDLYTRQGIFLFNKQQQVDKANNIRVITRFRPSDADLSFQFELQS